MSTSAPRGNAPDERPEPVGERVARLEAKLEHRPWWHNPGVWSVGIAALALASSVLQWTKPWQWGTPDIELEQAAGGAYHACPKCRTGFAATVSVVNHSSHGIGVVQVQAVPPVGGGDATLDPPKPVEVPSN